MREILFRGKRKDNGYWVEGYYTERHAHFAIPTPVIENTDYDYEVIPETVGQYTGLIDKNGTKIFEGDIINSKWGKFVIIYNTHFGGFVADENEGGWAWEFLDEIGEIEVISNIHDNPELLKGGSENA